MLTTLLLTAHLLVGVALLGAITHQSVGLLRPSSIRGDRFIAHYAKVNPTPFTLSIAVLFGLSVLLGGLIYPNYRLNVRIPFEQMSMGWAVGLFELKEHFGGIGIGLLPAYFCAWRSREAAARLGLTLALAFIVWWNFLVGHILNNLKGLT
jgi:predicted transporter